jgi:hypothetical protein
MSTGKRSNPKNPSSKLPQITAKLKASGAQTDFTAEELKGMICNPVYAGIGPYPQLVDDEMWVRAAARMIKEDGAEQFLVNMLYVLRQTMGTGAPSSDEE